MNVTEKIRSISISNQAIIATLGLCAVIYLYYTGDSWAQLVSIALFLGVLYVWSSTLRGFDDFQLKNQDLPLNIGVGLVLGLAMFLIYVVYERLSLSTIAFNASIVAAVTVVAAAEEFFFRGYLQGKLSESFGFVSKVIIVTALFGLYKVSVFYSLRSPLSLAEIVVISCIGSVILSIEMEKIRNLLAPAISHVIWDVLVYSNMTSMPSWIVTAPEWTEALYKYLFRFGGVFCDQWGASSYFFAGKQFVTCSGCTGIFLGVFIAFLLFEKTLFEKLHTWKFYVPGLLPQIFMFFGLNIADFLGILDAGALSAFQLQVITYSYTAFGLLLGYTGSVLMINTVRMDSERWGTRVESWLKDYEYLVVPALLLAFLSNPLSSPQMSALIFFAVLVFFGILTAVTFLIVLIVSWVVR
ncbi:MAG: CPBP family intramembrane metalloprotease [Theionarchaea archaeon]|nr:CPBP family intramembrane metalloprotease [Theionarchaea archaeon]